MSKPNTKLANSEVTLAEAHHELDRLWQKHKYVEVTFRTGRQRTLTQNAALHLFCEWLSEVLNDAGYDMRRTLRQDVEIPWSGHTVKEHLWKPVQKALLDKGSTTEADRVEYSEVYDVIARHMADKFGIQVPEWPRRKEQ